MSRYFSEVVERVALGWRLIEWKLAYYLPEKVHASWGSDFTVTDEEYDRAEVRYLELSRLLGLPNTIVHKGYPGFEDVDSSDAMMEVDVKRPSVQLVLTKLGQPKKRYRR
jgi:hypothetical protein